MHSQQTANRHEPEWLDGALFPDYTLAGFWHVLNVLEHLQRRGKLLPFSAASHLLDPKRSVGSITISHQSQISTDDAFEELFAVLRDGLVGALDVAEAVVAARPSVVGEFAAFLMTKMSTHSEKVKRITGQCLEELGSLIKAHCEEDCLRDLLYYRSLEGLFNFSGILGELGEGGLARSAYSGRPSRQYDRIWVAANSECLELSGFDATQRQLERVFDLISALHSQGIITRPIGMSRDEFAKCHELTLSDLVCRAISAGRAAESVPERFIPQRWQVFQIDRYSSPLDIVEKIVGLMYRLPESLCSEATRELMAAIGSEVFENPREALLFTLSGMSPERVGELCWLLGQIHEPLLLEYKALFFNVDRHIISDDASLIFDVRVDVHREAYGSISVLNRSLAPDVFQRVLTRSYREPRA